MQQMTVQFYVAESDKANAVVTDKERQKGFRFRVSGVSVVTETRNLTSYSSNRSRISITPKATIIKIKLRAMAAP
jgi:hypothetical protein